jgi:hypothetical protein
VSELPERALTYQAVIAEYFLGLKGSGLMLSPLDQEVVADWERRGVPVAVVCQGLRAGLEELQLRRVPGAGPPRSLRALRFAVEDAWDAYQAGRVGESPPPPVEAEAAAARLAAARAVLSEAGGAADGPHREGYREAWRALDRATGDAPDAAGSPLERLERALAAADARILAAWLGSLPRAERTALGPRVRLLAGPRPRATSRRAYRETLRAHLLDAAREAGLTCLSGSV